MSLKKKRTLVQWIDVADPAALPGDVLSKMPRGDTRDRVEKRFSEGQGPTKELLAAESFDAIYLLSNFDGVWNRGFQDWLGQGDKLHICPVPLSSPIAYAEIFQGVSDRLEQIVQDEDDPDFFFHLSPGTPAMCAIFVLLGKTRYAAKFLEVHNQKVIETVIPFSIEGLLAEVISDPQNRLRGKRPPSSTPGFESIIGESGVLKEAVFNAHYFAPRTENILLVGETGVGKQLFAEAIHRTSGRTGKFISCNMAELTGDLAATELFGYAKGAHSMAQQDQKGLFEQAEGGTLFLDEISECERPLQAKLLAALDSKIVDGKIQREIRPTGDTSKQVNVRVIAATNRIDPVERKQELRHDIQQRFNQISIPALRERADDIPLIAASILAKEDNAPTLTNRAADGLKAGYYEGNVRELARLLTDVLKNIAMRGSELNETTLETEIETQVRQAVQTGGGHRDVSLPTLPPLGAIEVKRFLAQIQEHYDQAALQATGDNTEAAGKLLGCTGEALRKRVSKRNRPT